MIGKGNRNTTSIKEKGQISGKKPLMTIVVICLILAVFSGGYFVYRSFLSKSAKVKNPQYDIGDTNQLNNNEKKDREIVVDKTATITASKKIAYSFVEVIDERDYYHQALRADFTDGYFTLQEIYHDETAEGLDDEYSEVLLKKYSKKNKLQWEKQVFVGWWPAQALAVDEKNKMVYIASYDQAGNEGDTVKGFTFSGKQVFGFAVKDVSWISDIVVHKDSFSLICVSHEVDEDNIIIIIDVITYSTKGKLIGYETIFSSKIQYLTTADNKVYVYDIKNNRILVKDLLDKSVTAINLEDQINGIFLNIFSFAGIDGGGKLLNNKLTLLVNKESDKQYVLLVLDVVSMELYYTDIIVELESIAGEKAFFFTADSGLLASTEDYRSFLIKAAIK